jgi:hypothetical protein
MERLEQVIGEIANYAPPEKCHDWEKRIRELMENEKHDAVFYSRQGIWEYIYSTGLLPRPY